MNVVKIIIDEDGEKKFRPKWHYIMNIDAQRTLCSGEVFGYGEGSAIFKTRVGKVTCPKCIAIIKRIKSVRL